MKVYRLCRENEVNQILNNQFFDNIGSFYSNFGCNIHNYDKDKRYLHFFKSKASLLYLNTLKNRYICVYDIPNRLLQKYLGKGKYRDLINFAELVEVEEYAIPSKLLKFKYLQSIDKIIEYIDVDEFLEDDSLCDFVENVYNKELSAGMTI